MTGSMKLEIMKWGMISAGVIIIVLIILVIVLFRKLMRRSPDSHTSKFVQFEDIIRVFC